MKLFGSKHSHTSSMPSTVGSEGAQLRNGTVVSVGKPRYKDQEPVGVKAGDEVIWRGGEDIELEDETLVLVDSYELLLKETD
jgi:co-chaperonin GroES (HSP10)